MSAETSFNIKEQMKRFEKCLDAWHSQQMTEMNQMRQAHQDQMVHNTDKIRGLDNHHKKLIKTKKTQLQEAVHEEKVIETLDHTLVRMKEDIDAFPEQIEAMKINEEEKKNQNRLQLAELEALKNDAEYQKKELNKGIAFFCNRLGLKLIPTDDEMLKLSFFNINPANPSQEYYFVVYVDDNAQYQVDSCVPAVDQVKELIDELSQTNDFSRFVQQMRRAFKATL